MDTLKVCILSNELNDVFAIFDGGQSNNGDGSWIMYSLEFGVSYAFPSYFQKHCIMPAMNMPFATHRINQAAKDLYAHLVEATQGDITLAPLSEILGG